MLFINSSAFTCYLMLEGKTHSARRYALLWVWSEVIARRGGRSMTYVSCYLDVSGKIDLTELLFQPAEL